MRVAREQLVFLCLVALDEVVHHCLCQPYPRTFALRATLATLFALGDGDRGPFDAFWRACSIEDGPDYATYGGRVRRNNELHAAYAAIYRAVGCPETIALREDISAARSDPGPHARAYQQRHRIDDALTERRRLYAEALRASSAARAARR